jgi:hypothetical protein
MLRRNFLICSFESQDGGKKGIAKNREEDQIIYLTEVTECWITERGGESVIEQFNHF